LALKEFFSENGKKKFSPTSDRQAPALQHVLASGQFFKTDFCAYGKSLRLLEKFVPTGKVCAYVLEKFVPTGKVSVYSNKLTDNTSTDDTSTDDISTLIN
jgi:hypothetical protein